MEVWRLNTFEPTSLHHVRYHASMAYLTERTITPEWLESHAATADQLEVGMAFVRRINRQWGGVSAVVNHLKRWSRHWPGQSSDTATGDLKPITVIDLGTGSADIPLAIVKWARANGLSVRITAVARNPLALNIARKHIGDEPWIDLVAADVHKLPFAQGRFDYAISSLLLHHLPDIEVMTVLSIMEGLSLRGMIWNDLSRSWLAHKTVSWMTLLSDQMIHHDAVASVQAGFSRNEVLSLRDRLGLNQLQYRPYWPFLFTLAGEHREHRQLPDQFGR